MFTQWLNFSNQIEVTRHTLHLARLSPAFAGYRVVQISDIHVGEWQNEKRLPAAVELVNQQQPDVIVITGDFVSVDYPAFVEPLTQGLSQLSAPDGIFAVLGNHDHHHGPDALRRVLQECGIQEIGNQVTTLKRGSAVLHIAGVDSRFGGKSCLADVLEQLPDEGAAILLAHEPGFATISAGKRDSPAKHFDLQLSGHSHGGQVRFPLIGSVFYPRHTRPYPRGLYHINGMIQYTNRGIGMAHLPIRLNCPPEISVFELQPRDR